MKIGKSAYEDDISVEAELVRRTRSIDGIEKETAKDRVMASLFGGFLAGFAVYAITQSFLLGLAVSALVGLAFVVSQTAGVSTPGDRHSVPLLLHDCAGSPMPRAPGGAQGGMADKYVSQISQRARHASDTAWAVAWHRRENTEAFDGVLASDGLLSAEILEELLAGEDTRLLVLKRLSRDNWETVRLWGESHGSRVTGSSTHRTKAHTETRLTLCLMAITPSIAEEIDIRGLVRAALGSTSKPMRELGIRVMSMGGHPEVIGELEMLKAG